MSGPPDASVPLLGGAGVLGEALIGEPGGRFSSPLMEGETVGEALARSSLTKPLPAASSAWAVSQWPFHLTVGVVCPLTVPPLTVTLYVTLNVTLTL